MIAQKQETIARVEAAISVLGYHIDIGSALKEMKRHGVLKEESYDALRNLLARSGKNAPGEYLGKRLVADRDFVDRAPVNDDADGPPTLQGGFAAEAVNENTRYLIIPDAHHPFCDANAWKLAIRCGQFIQPDAIIVLGDFCDVYSASFYDKSPTRVSRFVDELGECHKALDDLDSLGAESKHYINGNHENRVSRFIAKVPALHGLPGTTIEEMLSLPQRGWTSSKYLVEHIVGNVHFCHDYGQAGKYALGRATHMMGCDIVMGHTHHVAHYEEKGPHGDTLKSDTFGWLGSFDEIDYTHRGIAMQQWGHAIGWGVTRPDGSMRREAVRFINGRAKVDGQYV